MPDKMPDNRQNKKLRAWSAKTMRVLSPKWSSLFVGSLFYAIYALPSKQYFEPALLAIVIWQIFCLPAYSAALNAIDQSLFISTGLHTVARLGRLFTHTAVNVFIFYLLFQTVLLDSPTFLRALRDGATLGLAVSAISQGFQYVGLELAKLRIGDPATNVTLSLSAMMIGAGFSAFNFDSFRFVIAIVGTVLTVSFVAYWAWQDINVLRSKVSNEAAVLLRKKPSKKADD